MRGGGRGEEEGSGMREKGVTRDDGCGTGRERNINGNNKENIKGNIKQLLDTVDKYSLNV